MLELDRLAISVVRLRGPGSGRPRQSPRGLDDGLSSGDADGARTHGLLRDRHVQIRFTVVRGRLQASILSGSEEGCKFCRRPE